MITLLGKRVQAALLFIWYVACELHVMFLSTIPLGVIGRLCSAIVAIPVHIL